MVMRLIGDTAGQLTRMAKEIPHTVVYTQQYKLKVEKERGGGGWWLPRWLLLRYWLGISLDQSPQFLGGGEFFAFFLCVLLFKLTSFSFSNCLENLTPEFSCFCSSHSLLCPAPRGGNKWVSSHIGCWAGSTHHKL